MSNQIRYASAHPTKAKENNVRLHPVARSGRKRRTLDSQTPQILNLSACRACPVRSIEGVRVTQSAKRRPLRNVFGVVLSDLYNYDDNAASGGWREIEGRGKGRQAIPHRVSTRAH